MIIIEIFLESVNNNQEISTILVFSILFYYNFIWIERWWFSPTYTKISSVRAFFTLFHFCKNIFAISDYSSFVGLVLRHADEISLRSTYFLTGPKLALIYAHQRPTKVLLIFQSKKLWYKKSLQNCIFCKGYHVSTRLFRNKHFMLDEMTKWSIQMSTYYVRTYYWVFVFQK